LGPVHSAEPGMEKGAKRASLAGQRGIPAVIGGYDALIEYLAVLGALGLLFMPLLITADVLLRALNAGSIRWGVDVCEYILFGSTYLGAPWLLRLGLHVRVDILVQSLPKHFARRFEQGLDLIGGLICCTMAYYGALAALDAWRLDLKQYKTFTVVDWPFHVVFTLSMALLAIEFARRLPRPDEAIEARDLTVGV
jgi:TRAP-type C4-dicarboxylate transport system permease small subunit